MNAKQKRRYNLCCRLRAKGVEITTDAHAIEVDEQQFRDLGKTALRYVQELTNEYHYVVQFRIPDGRDGSGEMPGFSESPPVFPEKPARRKKPQQNLPNT